jgi:hypothetical protein
VAFALIIPRNNLASLSKERNYIANKRFQISTIEDNCTLKHCSIISSKFCLYLRTLKKNLVPLSISVIECNPALISNICFPKVTNPQCVFMFHGPPQTFKGLYCVIRPHLKDYFSKSFSCFLITIPSLVFNQSNVLRLYKCKSRRE